MSGRRTGLARILALHWFDVCSPWRVSTPLRALARLGYEFREAPIDHRSDLSSVDLVVLHRPTTRAAWETISEAHRRGIGVVVDVDDLFFPNALPDGTLMALSWHPLFHKWEAERRAAAGVGDWEAVALAPNNDVMERFHQCLAAADAVTVTTPELAAAYSALNPRVYVLPNCYDGDDPLWSRKWPPHGTTNVGFFGTDHHASNLALLHGALEPVLQRHPEARVVEAGGPALLPQIEAPIGQLVHLGSLPFPVLPVLLGSMDIVLAPLADTAFMAGKSNIRCVTAGLMGLPVVASPVGPYKAYVTHGINGFHARDPEEWTYYVERLVADIALRRAIGEENRRRARGYGISSHIASWVRVYESVLNHRGCARPPTPTAGHTACHEEARSCG